MALLPLFRIVLWGDIVLHASLSIFRAVKCFIFSIVFLHYYTITLHFSLLQYIISSAIMISVLSISGTKFYITLGIICLFSPSHSLRIHIYVCDLFLLVLFTSGNNNFIKKACLWNTSSVEHAAYLTYIQLTSDCKVLLRTITLLPCLIRCWNSVFHQQ